MLPTQQEGCLLRDAVRTMMSQICKVGVAHTSDLAIEGTIAVTVDRQKVIVIHFDDHLSSNQFAGVNTHDIVTMSSDISSNITDGFRSTLSELSARHFSTVLGSGGGCPQQLSSSRPGWYAGSSSSKMMNCLSELNETLNERVAIDVDSEADNETSFDDGLDLSDVANCSGSSSACIAGPLQPTDHQSPIYSSGGGPGRTGRRVKDAKNVIVIEDGGEMQLGPSCGVDVMSSEPNDEYNGGELKLLDSFASRCLMLLPSATDCESIGGDLSDSRSQQGSDRRRGGFAEAASTSEAALCCELCDWEARTNSQLESHLVAKHGVVNSRRLGRPIAHTACPVCGKRFRFHAQLDKHRRQHDVGVDGASIERPHRCPRCRNAYSRAGSLVLHAQVHDRKTEAGGSGGLGRLSCHVCRKTYANKVLFQKHIMYMHERVEADVDCT